MLAELMDQTPDTAPGVEHPFPFVERFPEGAREEVAAMLQTRQFRAGEDVVRQGDLDDSFYVLSSGSVVVLMPTGRGINMVVAEIPEGSVFGELSFFDSVSPRSATIRATSDGSAFRVTSANFNDLSAKYPAETRDIVLELARIMARRLRETSAKLGLSFAR